LKKQKKQGPAVDEEDKDLINPNHLPVKPMAISDLKAPRELSRRERCVCEVFIALKGILTDGMKRGQGEGRVKGEILEVRTQMAYITRLLILP
jgi:hypothetical protein